MVDTSYYRTVAETQILPEILRAEMLDFADEVDALLANVREIVEAAQCITNTCDFMGRSHITTDKVENLKKAIAAVKRHLEPK